MKKIFSLALLAMLFSFASFAITPISGVNNTCVGSISALNDSTVPAGTWTSSNTAVATVGLTTGYVYGVSAGVTTITYSIAAGYATMTFTVYTPPVAITGPSTVCIGGTTALSDATPGGTWSSSNTYYATVSATGVVYGAIGGVVYIYYSTGGTCRASNYILVTTTSVQPISGPLNVCNGATITLYDSTLGGVWSSGNTALATVNPSTGVVTGVSLGTVTISYAVSGSCGTGYAIDTIHVINTTVPGTISGSSIVNIGLTSPLYETVTGGVWSSSNTAVATINAGTGVVTGVAAGAATITYTVTGCGGSATATYTISVTPINGISGHVYFPGVAYYGNVKVWLINYNTATSYLRAIDSVSAYCYGGNIYYQFLGVATDSYRVKAAVYDSTGITTGYIPTYHTSSFYWYTANVINHTSGTADINEDINMAYGSVTSGPGFIGGYVYAGANKGTTTGVPVVGLSMNVFNSVTSQLMQSIRTDVNGYYSFSNLPVGATYYVFPDSLNYLTTAFTSIVLTTAAPTMNTVSFTQHTLSNTITPNTTGINNVSNVVSSIFAFPNPTNGKLNLQWQESANEKGNVTITDITGREIYKTVISMNEGTGVKQIDLSGFANGLYLITVKSSNINYNNKIQIQR